MISIRNLQRAHRVDVAALGAFAERAFLLCLQLRRATTATPLSTLDHIDALLISDRRMTALHAQFMNIPEPTDVLTFDHGEIFISVDTAHENARRFRTSADREIKLYLVHGLLHLHGFDDTTPAKAKRMQAVQARVLATADNAAR